MKLKTKSLVGLSLGCLALGEARAASVIGKTWFANVEGLTATEADQHAIEPIATVGFYTDATDANSVFYIPPIIPVSGIAGTLNVNSAQLKRADRLNQLKTEFFGDEVSTVKDLQKQISQTRVTYNSLSEKLAALPSDQEFLRGKMQAILQNLKTEMDTLATQINSKSAAIPGALREIYAEQFEFVLGSANVSAEGLDLTKAFDQGKAVGRINASYGGLFTINMVAGLSPEQYAAIRKYKDLRLAAGRPITFAMLPVQTVDWLKLTETVSDGESGGVPLFRDVRGGGNLQGMTVNLDLTLDAASSLSVAPPPFIVPVGTSTKLLQTLPPFKAKLDCVIKNGWFYKGRTDVRDGLIIYNNDITQNVVSDVISDVGSTEAPCKLSYIGGGDPSQAVREAAIRKATDEVMSRLQNLGIERSNLALAERQRFADGVQADIAANRHTGANKGWSSAIGGYLSGGWAGLAFGAFSQASNFYWHTDIRNIKMTDTIEFHTEIAEEGNAQVKLDLPMQVCLAWQPEVKAYERCTLEQTLKATSLTEAARGARKSPECEGAETSEACGQARNDSAPRNPETGTIDPLPVSI